MGDLYKARSGVYRTHTQKIFDSGLVVFGHVCDQLVVYYTSKE